MKGQRARRYAIALFLLFTLVSPTLADPVAARPGVLQAVSSSSQACFGNNGVDDSFIPQTVKSLRVAVVQPVFTSTPYSQYASGSFYAFYAKYTGVSTNVTTDLNLLSTDVSSGLGFQQGWGLSYGYYRFLTSPAAVNCGLVMGKNLQVLTDIDVSNGGLFNPQDKTARFDAVILPFSEYITVQEYSAYQDFVAGGGTLLMTGRSIEYPVTYDPATNLETLVYAHGWALHGSYASPIPCNSTTYYACGWAKNTTNWAGSTPCCFHNYKFNGSVVNRNDAIGSALFNEFGGTVFKSYASHEESRVSNMTGTSLASVYVNDSKNLIAAYTHQFRKGTVVAQCIFNDDIIATDPSAQYFLLLGLASGRVSNPTSSISSTLSSYSSSTFASTASSSSQAGPATSSASSIVITTNPTTPPTPDPSSTSLALIGGLTALVILAAVVVVRQRRSRPGG